MKVFDLLTNAHEHCYHNSQRERLHELEVALEEAQGELQKRESAAASKRSGPGDSDNDLQRVMEVLAKKTLECDQLREVRVG